MYIIFFARYVFFDFSISINLTNILKADTHLFIFNQQRSPEKG